MVDFFDKFLLVFALDAHNLVTKKISQLAAFFLTFGTGMHIIEFKMIKKITGDGYY